MSTRAGDDGGVAAPGAIAGEGSGRARDEHDSGTTKASAAPGEEDLTEPDDLNTVDVLSGPTKPRAEASGAALPFRDWNRYQILALLGTGGMGSVYKARDLRLNRYVAVKFLRFGQLDAIDAKQRRRFEREAQAQARIEHPHICKIYEVGEVEGAPYLAMQLIEGTPLSECHNSMSREQKLQIILKVTEALHAAHMEGVIHRDIKPGNIMVERKADGTLWPYLMDFGLARDLDAEGNSTTAGIEGTPAFMAPEQARGNNRLLDRRTDVYSLGATLYALLARRPPFLGAPTDVLVDVANTDPPTLRRLDSTITKDLETLVHKCMEKDPQRRYDSAREVALDLSRLLVGSRIVAKPPSLLHRLRRFGRQHRLLVASAGAALLASAILGGVALRARWQAAAQAKLAEELGQVVKEFELFMRSAYGLPTHDIRREQVVLRRQMTRLRGQLAAHGQAGRGALHYALGRGHLVLHEYAQAQSELEEAGQHGYQSPESRLALGMTLGERYRQELELARRAADRQWVVVKEKELEQQYLQPALRYLAGAGSQVEAPAVVTGLIALYRKDYESALTLAREAEAQAPWLSEPLKLAGDVLQQQGIEELERGEYASAVRKLRKASEKHAAAAEIGRSDSSLHAAEASDYLWLLASTEHTGEPPGDTAERAVAACSRARLANPTEPAPYLTEASVYWRSAILSLNQNRDPLPLVKKSIDASQKAVALDPNNWQSHYGIGVASGLLIQQQVSESNLEEATVDRAIQALRESVRLNPNAHWAWSDLGTVYMFRMIFEMQRGQFRKDLYSEFMLSGEKAAQMRPDISNPFANLSYGNGLVAEHHLEHGKQNEEFVQQAIHFAKRGQAVNPSDKNHVNNEAVGHLLRAALQILQRRDAHDALLVAEQLIERSLKLNPQYNETHQLATRIWYLRARLAHQLGRPVDEPVAQGLSAERRGEEHAPGDPLLILYRSRLYLLLGRANDDFGALQRAREDAQRAIKATPKVWEAQLQLCESARQMAESRARHGAEQSARSKAELEQWLSEGNAACDEAIRLNAHQAPAYVNKAAIGLIRAQWLAGSDARPSLASTALKQLEQALSENPLLTDELTPLQETARRLLRKN